MTIKTKPQTYMSELLEAAKAVLTDSLIGCGITETSNSEDAYMCLGSGAHQRLCPRCMRLSTLRAVIAKAESLKLRVYRSWKDVNAR